MQVTILGTGAFGLALGNLLHEKSKADIIFWTAFFASFSVCALFKDDISLNFI